MKLLNTLTNKKEEIEKPEGRPLNMFVCGPTVYDVTHIGHARTFIAFDALVRFLRSERWDVFYLQNITDVDDKIIKRALERGIKPAALATEYKRAYFHAMKRIGVTSVNKYAEASKFIPQIIAQIETLITKGHAYKIENSGYYFDVTTFPDYGKLSGRTVEQAEDSVTRIDTELQKKNRGDFALWKFVNAAEKHSKKKFTLVDGEPAWNTSLGWGRPGWHIEDTAISEAFFGPQYDIHGGAEDLKFPHHEAEVAQQEAASGKKPFVRIWLHTGFIRTRGEKMSKSLKNFTTIEDFLASHSPNALRWFILSHHYRSPINFDDAAIKQAELTLNSIQETLDKLLFVSRKGACAHAPTHANTPDDTSTLRRAWNAALTDDFNTPEAFAAVFSFVHELNKKIWLYSRNDAKNAIYTITETLATIGITLKTAKPPREIETFAKERELYRGNKQFMQADDLRAKIGALGYTVDDTPLGPFVRRTS